MQEIKPIKRRPELQPLSRDHHESLLFVWKIRQGVEKNIDIERLRAFVRWHFENHVVNHFQQEETILLPFMPNDPLMKRMKTEHELITRLVTKINSDASSDALAELASTVDQHIRFEERILFKHLEENLSLKDFEKIQAELGESTSACKGEDAWKDEFWSRK